ncbi:glycosyltransferase [Polaribacter ponticola]|uniref:Glycosyltransferase n=1 Tax=Polaribacter ponticola TaxID=2978475 RepID=A0ABT5S5K8_9FLAO|nr:glycosyltransferase [Polaribacter sp. MSW5]MDD7913388.1 glycosyltransferase [Polaribacter sp. MSW5]
MSNKNNFSVSISVYKNDSPEHFKEAMLSILNQTLTPNEIILVVDGPIPIETKEIIDLLVYENEILRVIELDVNLGHGNARRIGLENCTNNIVALMDSDDISVNNRFEIQYKFLLNNLNVNVIGGQIEEFEGDVNNIVSKRVVPETDVEIKEYLKYRCPLNQMTVMFRKDKVLESGGYLDWFCNEDYYLWIRMYLKNNIFHNLKQTLVKVRVNIKMFERRGGWLYFKSEYGIQKLMKINGIISFWQFYINVLIRFVVQVVLPNKVRRILFLKILRN